jgi:FKBP-type peptidyl-prolyl cis-trans isomerase
MSGFKKETTKEGSGSNPTAGQHVIAHYHGTLEDGKVFDSSVERGTPFEFDVGVGQVIKGWDTAFLDMKKGEKAVITCPPDYAYGAGGHPPVIPENATLTFEVELIDFS